MRLRRGGGRGNIRGGLLLSEREKDFVFLSLSLFFCVWMFWRDLWLVGWLDVLFLFCFFDLILRICIFFLLSLRCVVLR